MKILASHLYSFITYAQLRGVSPAEVLRIENAPSVNLTDEAATVSRNDFYATLSGIEQELKDEMLGLRVGEFLNLNALGLIYQISLQATTVEEGLLYLQSFLDATFPIIKAVTKFEDEEVVLCLVIEEGEEKLDRIILESTLTIIHRELRMMAGEELKASLSSPYHITDYPAFWTKGEVFSISFKPVVLKAAIKDQSHLHLDALVPEYLKLIERIRSEDSFTSKVKIAALQMARPELPGMEDVADVFNLTPRSFQRRLSTEKCTFRQISNELKKQLSYLLIHHDHFSVADVSYVLGYSEPAAFIHSFKKWHGNSPEKFRQKLTS